MFALSFFDFHIPKTGSDWMRTACYEAVEGPLDLHRSACLNWKETEGFTRMKEDPKVESDVFEQFVSNCMAVELRGIYRDFMNDLLEPFLVKPQ